ncbi:protein SAR DEFICIENT 1 [Neltuma alba]|uniref:protein SAR DEFICIENT 1 n=1 Tax=Neltuma alba TaxID=207710 RepID=UPI0010A35450|nr:protein SAR DEFICIENT 1-like [Prosopis alba]
MAAKRFFDDSGPDPDNRSDKRMRPTRPSFASIIGEVVMVKNMHNLFSALEPLLRRVVTEEVERAMRHCCPRSLTRSPSLRIEAFEQPQASGYQLMFSNRLSLPIFTGTRILDIDGQNIQVMLVQKNGDQMVRTSLPQPIKLELVVLDGDFPAADKEAWTTEEFDKNILKERTGKRPLLTGELNLTMRDGIAPTCDIEFTDNSSWIRSRKFRVAVRVAPGSNPGVRIREGMTEAFVVKDHRGELYKKHHPPMLNDEVWRLEKIGKDGAFHKKLSSESVNTVQDFLKLFIVDPHKLRKILGIGMSEKMWEVTVKHAKTCVMGTKVYMYRGSHFALYLNPICQLIKAEMNGHTFYGKDISTNINRTYIEKLVKEAYARWNCLEEIDQLMGTNMALLTQGDSMEQMPNNSNGNNEAISFGNEMDFLGDSYATNNVEIGGSGEWGLNNPVFSAASYVNAMTYNFSETQSDGNITPSASLMDGSATSRWP